MSTEEWIEEIGTLIELAGLKMPALVTLQALRQLKLTPIEGLQILAIREGRNEI